MPLNARLYKTEAIILRQRRLGEADRILTVYTPARGKMQVKAKGVRKTTSRMSGHLQPLTRCLLQMAQGHVSDVVTGCETLESFRVLREDLDRLSRAFYAAELVDRMTAEDVPGYIIYRLFLDTIRNLEQAADPDLALRYFEMRLLDQAGFRPQLDSCVTCQTPLRPEENRSTAPAGALTAGFFAPEAGGAVCRGCVPGLTGARVLSVNALKVLRLLQRGSYKDVARVRMTADLTREVERHLRSYVIGVLERDVNAAAFIEKLRRDGRNTEQGTGNKAGQEAPCS